MKRKIKKIFVEIETVRVAKKRSARKKTSEQIIADVSVEICHYASSFSQNGAQLGLSTNFFKENSK